jgi:enamine deaminase RidA (YjgF/YER057c/UK114 family)
MTPEQYFHEFRLTLPPPPKPVGVYKPLVVVDRLAYLSGHGPLREDRTLITGVVGQDLSLQEGYAAARQVGLAILATLRGHFGSLDRVKRVVKLLGMVNSAPNFHDQPKVINGCSELFAQIWGPELGVGARSAVGMAALPANIAVEIEGIFELHDT